MNQIAKRLALTTALATFLITIPLTAAVKTEQRTKVEFPGIAGGMARLFGGGAAREGVVSTQAVSGNRMMSITDRDGQLIDLEAEEIYDIEFGRERYRVTTFDEYRRNIQQARQEMGSSAQQQDSSAVKEMEIDVQADETGSRQTIGGQDCRQVVLTITMHEKGKTLEEAGGLVLTSDMWLGPEVPEMKEIADFQRRFAEKLGLISAGGQSDEQMAMLQQMYPAMESALRRFQDEAADMSGTAMLTVTTVESVGGEQQAAEEDESSAPRSIGGMFGRMGRSIGQRAAGGDDQPGAGERSKLMSTTTEVLSISTDVAATDVSIPEGFRERN